MWACTSCAEINDNNYISPLPNCQQGLRYLLGEKSSNKDEIRIEPDPIIEIPKEKFKWSSEV